MKNTRKCLSLLLTLCLLLALLPVTAFATGTGKAIRLVDKSGAAPAAGNIAGAQASNIYFGTYQQSDDGQGGYNTDPIKWRVLQNADGHLLLLSDQNLDAVQYNTNRTSVTWETSTIRSWLNGYGSAVNQAGTDYSVSPAASFLGTAFTTGEQASIPAVTVVNDNNPEYGTAGGNNTTDKLFLLSIAEAMTTGFGFTDNYSGTDVRKAGNTDYAKSRGVCTYSSTGCGDWWLRSPGDNADYVAFVNFGGYVVDDGYRVDISDVGVRPAFNIDLNSVLFTSAANGGKAGEGALAPVGDYSGSDWKLTLLDDARSDFTASFDSSSGDVWTIKYSGATAGTNEYISALVLNSSGEVTYYGRLAAAESGNDKTVTVDLEGKYNDGDTLYVFNEQYNGDYKTDYASAFAVIIKPTTLDVVGVTEWNDAGNESERPEKITVRLLAGGAEKASQEVSEGEYGLWAFSFDNLPIRDAQGQEIAYSVTADEIPSYTTVVESPSANTFRIVNTAGTAVIEVSTWTELQAALSAGGDIVLTADVTPDNPYWANPLDVPSGVTAKLDLNGHTVDRGYTEQGFDGSVIKVSGTLTVIDSDPAAGGSITGGFPDQYGGGVQILGGTFNLEGGSITGNSVGKTGFFGTEGLGGGVYLQSGVFNMSDGAITGNKALGSSMGTSLGRGGGVYITGGTFNFTGGEISGNDAGAIGGGVYLASTYSDHDGTISVSGDAAVKDNTVGTKNSNVYLEEGGVLSVTDTLTGTVGVTMQTPGVFTNGLSGRGTKENFISDDAGLVVSLTDGGEAQLKVEEYPLWVGGVQVTSVNKGDITAAITAEGGTASGTATYDPDSGTLTLTDFQYSGAGYEYLYSPGTINERSYAAGIFYSGNEALIVDLSGESAVTVATTGDKDASYGLRSDGYKTAVTFTGTGNLRATGGQASNGNSCGISVRGTLTVESGAAVTGVAGQSYQNSVGVDALDYDVYGSLIGTGGTSESNTSFGIFCSAPTDPKVTVYGGGVVNATAGSGNNSFGVSAKNIDIRGGELTASSGTATRLSRALDYPYTAQTGVLAQGSVNADGADAVTYDAELNDSYKWFHGEKPAVYTVTVTPGANMMIAAGADEQTVQAGDAMERVVYMANEGYYFPEDYAVASVNSVAVMRDSFTQITVFGTPTGKASITLPDPTAKVKEPTPTATFTATGPDAGTLTGVTAGMTYAIDGGAAVEITAATVELTGLAPCTITVIQPGNDTTTIDSETQTITITKAETPSLTATQPSTIGGTGSIPTTTAHEISEDGTSWTTCTGETTGLAAGTYYVRVKAAGTALASEAQEITITAFVPTQEPTPAAVFTATGPDTGTLANVTAGMSYAIDGGAAVEITGTSVDLTGLAPCTITVIQPGNDTTTIDSAAQSITVTKAATPTLTATQPSTIGGTGSIPATAAHEISEDGTTWTACTGETTGLAAGTYYVRVKAAGTVLASDAQEITITAFVPTQEPTPTAAFTATGSDSGTLTGVTAGMTYAIDGGSAVEITGTGVDLTGLAPCTITVIQPGNGTTTIDSDAQTITVTKAETPTLTATQPSTIGGTGSIPTTAEHEFSEDGTTWTACTGETSGLAAGTYYVRVKAAGTVLASEAQEIAITAFVPTQEPTPNAAFTATGPDAGTLTGITAGMTYAIDGGAAVEITGTTVDITGLAPCTITVIQPGNGTTTIDSAAQSIAVTKAATPDSVTAEDCSTYANNNGKLIGITSAMEYKKSDAAAWISGTGDDVTGLVPGTYHVRVAASGTVLASDAQEITVAQYVTPPSDGWTSALVTELKSGESITSAELDRLIREGKTLTVIADNGAKAVFDTDALKGIAAQTTGSVKFVFEAQTLENVEDGNTDYALTLTSRGTELEDFGGTVTLRLPYALDEGGNPRRVILGKTDENGSGEHLETTYDAKDRSVTASVSGDSVRFALGYVPFPYKDVPRESYYYDAVDWADLLGITKGTAPDMFSPNGSCTRAQMVTFLWRAQGRPEPATTDNPFTDLDESAYYYEAVLWAAENGITLGIGDGKFDPDGTVPRAQMVTFLWRAAGKPESATTENPFTDLDESAYYYKAVLWAFENGITLGTGDGKFSPNDDCLRAQIVTFLYRAYNEE